MAFVVPPCKLRDIGADMLAGCVEFGLFAFGECGIEDFFNAVRADDAGYRNVQTALTILPVKPHRAGHHRMLVVQNGPRDAHRRVGDGVNLCVRHQSQLDIAVGVAARVVVDVAREAVVSKCPNAIIRVDNEAADLGARVFR